MPGVEASVETQWMRAQSEVEGLRTLCQATAQSWHEEKKRAVFSFPVSKRRLEWVHLHHGGQQLDGMYNLSFQHDEGVVARCRVCGEKSAMSNWREVFEPEFPGSGVTCGFFCQGVLCDRSGEAEMGWSISQELRLL